MLAVKASGWLNTDLTPEERSILINSGLTPVNDAFYPYFNFIARYEIYYGSRGSSKSHFVVRKILNQMMRWQYLRGIYCRKHAVDIRESQYDLFKIVASDLGIYNQFTFYETTMKIVHRRTKNTLIARGLDEVDKTKSISDPNMIWCEEPTELEQQDFVTLNAGLRTQKGPLQVLMTFNPIQETNWMRTFFFSKENAHKLKNDFTDAILCRTTFRDNYFIDQKAYETDLRLMAAGNKNFIRVSLEGDWGISENGNPWLYAFDYDKHCRDLTLLSGFPVYLSFDVNNDPFTCVALQFSVHRGSNNSFIHVLKEFSGEIKVEDICSQILTSFPNSLFHITGDRSGQNKDVGRNKTVYDMIKANLRGRVVKMDLNTHNLEHADSRILINQMFAHYPNIFIDKSCNLLLKDIEKSTVDEEKGAGHLKKDRKDFKMDLFDGMRYFFQTYFLDFAQKTYFKAINKVNNK